MSWVLRLARSSTMAAAAAAVSRMPLLELCHAAPNATTASRGRWVIFLESRALRNAVPQGLRATRHLSTTSPERGFGNGNAEYKKRKARIEYFIGRTAKVEATAAPVVEPAHNEAAVELAILDRLDAFSIDGEKNGSSQSVVVVESPSKAKTITKYLGSGFTVLPSYGHVRDLAPRAGSVRPDDDFNMLWEVPGTARPHINAIKAALKGAQVLVLASDPDREGEAIAWHVLEMLTNEGALHQKVQVKRVVFHEITKTAVIRAMESARDVSETLVNAYLARRALDYLIGFSLSPVLWRKLPGSKSAGRVQSAALRLICDREQEIEAFHSREYWSVEAKLEREDAAGASTIAARLTHLNGEKLGQFSLGNESDAGEATEKVAQARLRVGSVKKRSVRRNPLAPYITSTLQQDASSKLGFGATRTMSIAQLLYEGVKLNSDEQTGLITYMRTDGPQIAPEAVESIRSLAVKRYGATFVPAEKRVYVSKVKNAQEAHEAIRPTDISRLPSSVANVLEDDALQLYTLIWARTMACQMESAVSNQVSVDVEDELKSVQLRASTSAVSFPGFLAVYEDVKALGKVAEKLRDDDKDEIIGDLNKLKAGDPLLLSEVRPIQHFTEPPPRFSEGTLVKHLEELGIGRPSTYAPTLRTLQLRNYVKIDKRRIVPETRGRMVSAFLIHYFPDFADFAFTANIESQLDEVSAGQADWKKVLGSFWPGFHGSVTDAMKVPVDKVVEMLEEALAKQFSPMRSAESGDRICPSCKEGKVSLKLSRFGAGYFFGCNRHPDCTFIANMEPGEEEESSDEDDPEVAGSQWSAFVRPPKILGVDPTTQLQVAMRVGPYGSYVQLGEASRKQKPRRTTVPKGVKPEDVTLEMALEYLTYPRELGKHPLEGSPILISIGKFGFFLRHRAIIASVPQGLKVEDLTMDKAVEILKGKHVSRRGRKPRAETLTTKPESSPSSTESEESVSSLVTSAAEEQQSRSSAGEKPKRKYTRTSAKHDTKEVSVPEVVVPKRGRGRPRKHPLPTTPIAQGE